jgi:hypothetical protein
MADLDPRYATFPKETGIPQLRWLIEHVADGHLPVEELIRQFRPIHEAIERQGRPHYTSTEEAHLIWDVLWALEFYSPAPSKEDNPREWHGVGVVLAEVQRAAKRLKEL